MTEKNIPENPKDGFDLIEYPCEFNFKAMCKAEGDVSATDYIRAIIEPLIKDGDLLKMHSNTSRTGKFESVTAVVRIYQREQLESIYQHISNAERVVMTL